MQTLKNLAGWILLFLFRAAVSLAITLAALSATLGNPAHLKSSLTDSAIYNNLVGGLLSQVAEQTKESEEDQLASDPKLRAVASSAFTPQLLQESAESFIDGFYGWLSGEAENLSFTINLAQAKQDLANGIAEYAAERMRSLPACQPSQITPEFDPLTAECRPPIDINAEQKKLAQKYASSEEFLGDTNITEEDLPKGENGEPFQQANAEWPDRFQLAKSLPIWLGGVGLALAGSYILLNEDRKKGVKRVAKSTLATCAMLVISTLIFLFIFNRVRLIAIANPEFQESVVTLFKDLAGNFAKVIFTWSIVLGIISATALLLLRNKQETTHKTS